MRNYKEVLTNRFHIFQWTIGIFFSNLFFNLSPTSCLWIEMLLSTVNAILSEAQLDDCYQCRRQSCCSLWWCRMRKDFLPFCPLEYFSIYTIAINFETTLWNFILFSHITNFFIFVIQVFSPEHIKKEKKNVAILFNTLFTLSSFFMRV